jgi:hypothetical protein
MFGKYFEGRKYRKDALSQVKALLWFYPAGRDQLQSHYPNIGKVIADNVGGDYSPDQTAMLIAGSILAHVAENATAEQRAEIWDQWAGYDHAVLRQTVLDLFYNKGSVPAGLLPGTVFYATAMMIAKALLDDGKVEERNYENFRSEVLGALSGKSPDERQRERVAGLFEEINPREELRADETDIAEATYKYDFPLQLEGLSGREQKVRLVRTATGIAMVDKETGAPVTERRELTQDDLEKVPSSQYETCTFVNVKSRFDERLHSCIIYGDDSEVVGSGRSFWWALARTRVWNAFFRLGRVRMTGQALALVHASARAMIDVVLKQAGSVENLRDEIMPMRHAHFDVITKLMSDEKSAAQKLGLDLTLALVLAIQSEDAALEAIAVRYLAPFFWQPGEEPVELHSLLRK